MTKYIQPQLSHTRKSKTDEYIYQNNKTKNMHQQTESVNITNK